MKSICKLLLAALPIVLTKDQKYKVPDLEYDNTEPTCENVNELIAFTTSDLTRFSKYVSITLPERSSKLNDVYASIQKTCEILKSKSPSLVQTELDENIHTLKKLSNKIKHIAHSLSFGGNEEIGSSFVHMKMKYVSPNDLCEDTQKALINLKNYIRFLIPAITETYIEGILSDRLSSLNDFHEKCFDADCNKNNATNTTSPTNNTNNGGNGSDEDSDDGSNDYDFYPTLDSDGGDITLLTGYSVKQLKKWCTANTDCLGFNDNGWVKSYIRPKKQWVQWTQDEDLGLYLKKSVDLDNDKTDDGDEDYVFYPHVDSDGNDIKQLSGYSVQQLKDYCNSNADCLAFNNNGWVKYALRPKSQWVTWTSDDKLGFYVKVSCVPVENSDDE